MNKYDLIGKVSLYAAVTISVFCLSYFKVHVQFDRTRD